jgi:hypothetical protein
MTFLQLHSAVSIVLVLIPIQNSGEAEVAGFVYVCISWQNHLVFQARSHPVVDEI